MSEMFKLGEVVCMDKAAGGSDSDGFALLLFMDVERNIIQLLTYIIMKPHSLLKHPYTECEKAPQTRYFDISSLLSEPQTRFDRSVMAAAKPLSGLWLASFT